MNRTFVYKLVVELLKNRVFGQIRETFLTRSGAREGQTRGVTFGVRAGLRKSPFFDVSSLSLRNELRIARLRRNVQIERRKCVCKISERSGHDSPLDPSQLYLDCGAIFPVSCDNTPDMCGCHTQTHSTLACRALCTVIHT
jgi:hypothetical protein